MSLNRVRTTKFSKVGVNSSSSRTCSPWGVKLLACIFHKSHRALVQILKALIHCKVYIRKNDKLCAGGLETKVLANSLPDEFEWRWMFYQRASGNDRAIVCNLSGISSWKFTFCRALRRQARDMWSLSASSPRIGWVLVFFNHWTLLNWKRRSCCPMIMCKEDFASNSRRHHCFGAR